MVRSSPPNQVDTIANNWAEIGALLPVSPRAPPIPRNRPLSMGIYKRRSISSKIMVRSAIKTLTRNPRAGVSLTAIKKYIAENYGNAVSDVKNRFRFVKRYIKNSLEKGELVRTKGNGFSGSFRLPFPQQYIQKKKTQKKSINKKKNKQFANKKSKELHLNAGTSRTKVNSNASGSEGETGGGAEFGLRTAGEQASAVKAVSKGASAKYAKPMQPSPPS
ncbi:histone H1-III-like [Rhagoletis pomonella]|uniref:histone H1-III-like n=1 Tax=Rhagoletis pomonella TaxID=28610 RepID=UPI001781F6F3|nr:histone H1-III-like [Rhagoletis pomonella]